MDKTAWQVIAFIAIGVAVVAGASAAKANRALAVATAAVADASPVLPAVHVNAPTIAAALQSQPHATAFDNAQIIGELEARGLRCIDGYLFKHRDSEWLQLGTCPEI